MAALIHGRTPECLHIAVPLENRLPLKCSVLQTEYDSLIWGFST